MPTATAPVPTSKLAALHSSPELVAGQSTGPHPAAPPALAAYETLAPHYDALTAAYDHERWLASLLALAHGHGLLGRRLLDVGCGTGKSFLPLLQRGFQATGCDLSPAMVALARERAGDRARVFVADMRELPDIGPFDLVTCLDDALNYLLGDEDLLAAFRSMARVLDDDGLVLFDVNTLATYRSAFAQQSESTVGDVCFRWSGEASADVEQGAVVAATVTVTQSDGRWVSESRHIQRHRTRAEIEWALASAGLVAVGRYGQLPGARLHETPDEQRDSKLVWIVRKAPGFFN